MTSNQLKKIKYEYFQLPTYVVVTINTMYKLFDKWCTESAGVALMKLSRVGDLYFLSIIAKAPKLLFHSRPFSKML